MNHFDHIIVGTGQATGTLLGKLIPTGDRIAVIEGHKVGGSCVNYGCTPTKTLVASARAAHMARRAEFYGVRISDPEIDYGRVRERMNEIRNSSSRGLAEWMEESENVDLIRAWARFTGPRELEAGDRKLSADRFYINTGTHAFVPQIEGLDDVPWVDSEGLLALEDLPPHLVILGGGYVGVEMAQIYRRFGSQVTIVQKADQLMPREDRDVADAILEFLREEGVRVVLEADARLVEPGTDSGVRLTASSPEGTIHVTGSHLLVAVGRRPNSERLELDEAGIATTDRGFIQVDDHCRTNVEGVFAVGDVNGHGAFTHTSVNDAEIVLDLLFGDAGRTISQRIPVYALFSDPPLGRVGLSEKDALEQGYRVLKATRPMSKISRAREMGETRGFAKLLVDAETDLIIGAAILGPGGDEIINMFAAIMHSGIPCRSYRQVVLVHPTVAELMPFVLDGLEPVE